MPKNKRRYDMVLGSYDSLLAYDHGSGRVFSVSTGIREHNQQARGHLYQYSVERWRRRMKRASVAEKNPHPLRTPAFTGNRRSNFTRTSHEAAVEQIIRYIRTGDILQANLSRCLELQPASHVSPFVYFRRLHHISPAPFGAFLNLGKPSILSSSPERFLE